MAWKKGQSGKPLGRPREKVFADAIRMVLAEDCPKTGKRKLRRLAEKLYEQAMKGEGWAMCQIADRLDGNANGVVPDRNRRRGLIAIVNHRHRVAGRAAARLRRPLRADEWAEPPRGGDAAARGSPVAVGGLCPGQPVGRAAGYCGRFL